jgi:hypothetical protein
VQIPNNNTFVDGPSLSLVAGTWLVVAHVTLNRNATTLANYVARLTNGTTHYASGQGTQPSQNPHAVSIPLTARIVLGATTTVKIQAATSAGSTTTLIKAATGVNGSGNNATQLTAVKLA